jgi:hypothetical protein
MWHVLVVSNGNPGSLFGPCESNDCVNIIVDLLKKQSVPDVEIDIESIKINGYHKQGTIEYHMVLSEPYIQDEDFVDIFEEISVDYVNKDECISSGGHLTDCDNSGFCNHCGEQ